MSKHFSCNNFDYSDSDNPKDRIKHSKSVPERLFKFYSLTKWNVDALVNKYLYASHPFELNDILDCNSHLFLGDDRINYALYSDFYKNIEEGKLKEYYEHNKQSYHRSHLDNIWTLMSNTYGIVSLTEEAENTLMWPHYTQETGFQIEFSVKRLEEEITSALGENNGYLLVPINYTDKVYPINVCEFERFTIPYYYSINVKSAKWKYENEWRIILDRPSMGVPYTKVGFSEFVVDELAKGDGRKLFYGKEGQAAITFGRNFFNRRRFNINKPNESTLEVEVKSDEDQLKELVLLLDHTIENMLESTYLSGTKYEVDEKDQLYIRRNPERVTLAKKGELSYQITRTNEIL